MSLHIESQTFSSVSFKVSRILSLAPLITFICVTVEKSCTIGVIIWNTYKINATKFPAVSAPIATLIPPYPTIDTIINTVAEGEKIQIAGFGTFEQRQRNARTGCDPRTGKSIEIPASKVPAFKAGKGFKDVVNK